MCIILFSYNHHPKYRFIVAANRDEVYNRPTEPASFWKDQPGILAGRDLEQLGTWMGITRTGRLAALTNIRKIPSHRKDMRSRGELVSGFLSSEISPSAYLSHVKERRDQYLGFNLLVADKEALFYYNSDADQVEEVSPGIHGLSNAELDTPWPKVERGKQFLEACTDTLDLDQERLFELLSDDVMAQDHHLPDTGAGIEWERILSPVFISSPNYGTRSSTVLTVTYENQVEFIERTYCPIQRNWSEVKFDFSLSP